MLIHLNTGDDRPIYAQIVEQVTFAVAAGWLKPGELAPSVRELSRQLVVNPNTVARAYRELQGMSVLKAVRGTGLQVAEGAPERCRVERRALVRRRLRGAIDEALRSKMDLNEIEAMLFEEWAGSKGEVRNDSGQSARENDHE